uniref:Ig-like domain-containing protein n=1 Tax=Oreochromis aureus TaxID=47969 RepID=A0AAZ1XFW4_OREAU
LIACLCPVLIFNTMLLCWGGGWCWVFKQLLICLQCNLLPKMPIIHWYKQSVGDTLILIVTLFETATPEYGQEIFKSRFQTHYDKKFSNLTILKAVQDDEGIYHCGIIEWINPEWTGTYLLVKGKLVIHCHTFIHFKVFQGILQTRPQTKQYMITKADEELNYAALHFSERKTRRKRKTEFAEDSVYSQVKC